MIADSNKVPTKECLRYLRIPSGVINPTLDKKYTKMGNSKTTPLAKVVDTKIPMYDESEGRF